MKKIMMWALVLFSVCAIATPAEESLKQHLNAIHTMKAQFSQQVSASGRTVSSSSGHMALSRPGKFLWQTDKPMRQVVVADGQSLWVYDVELEQVTVKRQEKGLGGTPALFLSGYDDSVARDFRVSMHAKGTRAVFDLNAKSSKLNFQAVRLVFEGETLSRLELDDQLGQHTLVNMTHVKTNPQLSNALFQFKPPKGVDVVRQ